MSSSAERRFMQRVLGASALLALVISASCNTKPKAIAPTITTTSAMLANADQNVAYNANVTASGGTAPFTWTITSGPAWLTTAASNTNTVAVQGTPPAAVAAPFTIKVTDAKGLTNSANLSITVNAPPTITTTSAQLAVATQGAAYNSTVTEANGTGPFTWQILAGGPAWLTTSANNPTSTVTIQGTPPANTPPLVNFSMKVTDAAGGTFTTANPLAITVNPPAALTITTTQAQVPSGDIGIVYPGANMVATGGIPPYTWANPSNSLTTVGLALNTSTGVVSGTPTTTNAGVAIVADITVTDQNVPPTTPPATNFNISIGIANPDACGTVLGGSESLLKGEYTFYVSGYDSAGGPYAFAASFNADGTGKLSTPVGGVPGVAGHEDFITSSAPATSLDIKTTGAPPDLSYTVGADHRGCITLVDANSTHTFRFALGGVSGAPAVASKGRIIEFDDAVGNANRASGILRQQTTTDFVAANLKANYAFGMDGLDLAGGHYVVGGSFTLNNANGNITNLFSDIDDAGVIIAPGGLTAGSGGNGSFTLSSAVPVSPSATTGRMVGSLSPDANHTYSLAIYVVNASEFFAITTDTLSATKPILSGRFIVTGSAFTNASAAATVMIHVNGSSAGSASGTIGILTLTTGNPNGTITGNLFNSDGSTQSETGTTYIVNSVSGRVALTQPPPGGNGPALYLTTPTDGISAFIIGLDNSAIFGYAEAQSPTSGYTANSLSGNYFFGLDEMTANADFNQIHVLTLASAVIQSGTGDSSDQSLGLVINTADAPSASNSFTVNAIGDGSGSFNGFASTFVTDGTKMFLLDQSGSGNIFAVDK